MVVEVKCANGEWEAFVADRLPAELDDQIKAKHVAFYMGMANLTPAELKDIIPMSFPMTYEIPDFPGVARYPVDRW